MTSFDFAESAFVLGAFTVAGFVKGVAGFGLPTVTLGLLALTRPLPEAMALMLVPTLLTNVWQSLVGPALWPVLRRLWPFLAAAVAGTLAGAGVLARSDAHLLSGLLGLLLVASAALALLGLALPTPTPGRERWLSPAIGGTAGLLTGMTGSFLFPAAPYLAAMRLPPQHFVQGFGLGALLATLALALGMAGHGLLPPDLGLASLVGVAPAFLGMALGTRVRRAMPETRFRDVIQVALGLVGLWLAVRAFA
ncbi:sulfite exporter TauE/SafE family protein [Paracraurococcus lichenis]|uniref:Probable membrane transporter protein n=1 Tax=Paracraurococcus lichenis TaxID=3064888 RepID=A0ABT9E9W9_9PROT|nr:sulfite exporter TauE/SafE family protein [Paracraurococcus sp. LOR1-02]MDO9712990.1 sulfite exporter TauE/SafE family protein [Paracraurococcus sp. LOR1-02]